MSRRAALRWAVAVALAAWVQAASPARAFHTVFHFMVDRFEVDGNTAGPFDGTPDLVDEFENSANFADRWRILFGTAYEGNGLLHLTNPGTHFNPGFPLDLSDVATQTIFTAGGGSFTAQSTWPSLVVPPDNLVHMSIWFAGETDAEPWETFGIDISNFAPAGLVISQHLIRLDTGCGRCRRSWTSRSIPRRSPGRWSSRTHVDDAAKLAQGVVQSGRRRDLPESLSTDAGLPGHDDGPRAARRRPARGTVAPDDDHSHVDDHDDDTARLPGDTVPCPPRVDRPRLRQRGTGRRSRSPERSPLPGVVAAGQTVTVDVGGVQRTFQLDATGRGRVGRDRIRVGRGPRAPFVVELRRGAFAPALADEGLTPGRFRGAVRTLPLRVDVGSSCFGKAQFFLYSATRTGRGHAETSEATAAARSARRYATSSAS
jgi:hypothetical protein